MNTRRAMSLVLFLAVLGVAVFFATAGVAQEKVEGMVVSLKIDKCGMKPGSCEGSIGIGEPGRARTVRVEGGTTTIKKGGQAVVLQEVKLGDKAVAQVERKEGKDIAKAIEVTAGH